MSYISSEQEFIRADWCFLVVLLRKLDAITKTEPHTLVELRQEPNAEHF